MEFSEQYLQKTIDVWQPYYTEELRLTDAVEILENWSAFMNLLTEWAIEEIEEEHPNPEVA